MKGKIIADWRKVNLGNTGDLKKVLGAFQMFMRAIDRNKDLRGAYQAFTTKGDFPPEVLMILEKFHAIGDFDLGYEQVFDIRDFTGTKESGFDILDVSSSLVFAKIPVGDKIKVFKATGSKISVGFDRYGGGLGWDKTWLDDGKYWALEDTAIEFRNKAYLKRSQAYYSLIEALPLGKNVVWQAPTPTTLANTNVDYAVSRDINTIQKACDEILEEVKNKGYGVTANSPFVIVTPNVLRPRMERAISHLNQQFAGSSRALTYNVKPVYTLMLTKSNADYYVCLPGKKLKGGYRMDLTLFNMLNILSYIETIAGWMRYGGAIGDTAQLRRCKTS